jgi:cytochrome c-type biogenesis protein CcmH/NrfG
MADRAGARTFSWKGRIAALACLLPCGIALTLTTAPAQADWVEVSSDHFVIYGEQRAEALQNFAERLELFHAAMTRVFKRDVPTPSPSNRVTVFVVSNTREVRELVDSNNRFLGGLYLPRAGQSVALVPRLTTASSAGGEATETTLFHEYAHHFMRTMTSYTHPRWFSEGFAEFFSSVRFTDDQIGIGTPAQHRAYELSYARNVPIRDLLDYAGGASANDTRYNAFYGQAWTLFHYLVFAPERAGQLSQYERFLTQGKPALEAAETAFGDFKQLDKDLDRYLQRRMLRYLPIPKGELKVGAITARVLPAAESAIMPMKVRSRTGVSPDEAAEVVIGARRIAQAHPGNPVVLTALAEAEFDAGHHDAAIAAADRAIALDPTQINAHIQKGYALSAKIQAGDIPNEAWKGVRSQWVRANKVEPDNPIPLYGFYATFLAQGTTPTPNSILGLERALAVAPFDGGLRWSVAQQRIADGRLAEAAAALGPLAYSPHPGQHTDAARKLLEEVQARIAARQDETAQVGQTH